MSNFISKIDYFIAKLFHNIYVWGGEFANHLMELISWIAEAGILFLLVGLGLALFKRTRKTGGTILIAVALGFLATNIVLKNIIERTRPFGDISSDFYKWWLDAGATHESGYSFPSGHTTATTAFAVAIFLTTNKKYSWPVLTLPLLMASSRIYLMVHYFTDCVGGLIVGTTVAILAYIIIKLIYKSKWKFFVWIREFNVFKPKQKIEIPANTTTQDKIEEFVYTTQTEEQNSSNTEDKRLIEQEIEKKEETSSNKE
jgi:undecaprenyl-diphosphatase